jgi:hypothetical protein
MTVNVKIYSDRMEASTDGQVATTRPERPYAGRRILVGTMVPAEDCLKRALKELGVLGALKPKPRLSIQAMEMNEGGLSEVEQKVLMEIGLAAGARDVEVF